ncbi:MAG: D-alanyl-D-alanine carboxypeptidase/D-alanyl-D-alanine-endopeptidase [Candidatus Dactylopiibacterium sp.]|nr:D-alanyl-D-alanine carboxypeptidase/D-alanyl-D-alanine-endopeptidase [Candidatus Dactylopiibacterium sp.]
MIRLPALLLALAALLPGLCRATLPTTVARAAHEAALPADAIALWAAPAAGGAPFFTHNSRQAMNPASVMKLLTSHAALETLGSAHVWKTQAALDGTLADGVLTGRLVITAGGDPDLTWDRLGLWLRDWRARGLREIRGDIVIDTARFAPLPAGTAFDAAPHRAYNARPDAFLVNFGALTLRLQPAPAGAGVAVTPLTPAAPLVITNRIASGTGACTDWRNSVRASFTPAASGLALTLEGRYPASCGERELNLRVGDSLAWAGAVIRAQWAELGGRWQGEVVEGATPPQAQAFSRWESPALPEVLRDMNKWSNNVMAQQILLALGGDDGRPLSAARAIGRLRDWMPAHGLDPAQWVLENGSGLSRLERTTAAELGALLQDAWNSPRMPEFVMGLPVIGRDGTMRSRLVDSPLAGRGYVKTGTLDGVKSAAGYLLDAQGRWVAFAILLNHPQAPNAERVIEETLRALYAR